ncbi:MAG: hypothetical protein U0232_09160 [Thermomicrobiales bacterium]
MSRSRRKHPFIALCTAASEKDDKVHNHRRYRRAVKLALHAGSETLPIEKELSNPWAMAKDGKTRLSKNDRWLDYDKMMRK